MTQNNFNIGDIVIKKYGKNLPKLLTVTPDITLAGDITNVGIFTINHPSMNMENILNFTKRKLK